MVYFTLSHVWTPACIYVPLVCVQCPQMSEEAQSPVTGVADVGSCHVGVRNWICAKAVSDLNFGYISLVPPFKILVWSKYSFCHINIELKIIWNDFKVSFNTTQISVRSVHIYLTKVSVRAYIAASLGDTHHNSSFCLHIAGYTKRCSLITWTDLGDERHQYDASILITWLQGQVMRSFIALLLILWDIYSKTTFTVRNPSSERSHRGLFWQFQLSPVGSNY